MAESKVSDMHPVSFFLATALVVFIGVVASAKAAAYQVARRN